MSAKGTTGRNQFAIPEHGTLAGYKKHIRDKTPPCPPCKVAARENGRRYLAKLTPEEKAARSKKNAAYDRARRKAVRRLIDLYPIEYEALMLQEEKEEPSLCGDEQPNQETQE